MKKICSTLIIFFLMLATFIIPQGHNVYAATTTIDLLSINDFHGRLEQAGKDPGIAKLTGYIKQYQATNPNTVVLGAGDLFQGSPISNLTKGDSTAKALKELNVPYSALGNHEFDWEPAEVGVPKWEATGGLKFLAANIYDTKTKQRATFAKPTAMVTIAGKKIGLIGIATPETAYKTNLANIQGLEFRDPVNDINTLAADLKAQGANAVVVLSHLGAMQDASGTITGEAAEAAKKISGVHAIISGHTHQTIQGKVNGVSIVQAASYGRAVGHTQITFDDATGAVTDVTPKVDALSNQVNTLPVDQKTADVVANERKNLASLLDVPVATTPTELERTSSLGQYFSYLAGQQLVDKGYLDKQPIVLMNSGGFRDSIAAGTITQGTMYNILPFDNYLVAMDLTREQIKKNLENDYVGWLQTSGLTVYYDPTKPAGDRVVEMYYTPSNEKGEQTGVAEPLVDGKLYQVVVNDFMFTGGDRYDFTGAKNVKTYDGDLVRDAIQSQLKKAKEVTYNHVPRLLALPDQANKLPKFNANTTEFEFDLSTGTMFKVDSAGKKAALAGTQMTEILNAMIAEAKGDNSADVSKDYVEYTTSGTFIDVINGGANAQVKEFVSGETYELIITATDGKISPAQTRSSGSIKVTKAYGVKVVGQKSSVNSSEKSSTTKTEKLPDTSGKNKMGIVGLSAFFLLVGIVSYVARKNII